MTQPCKDCPDRKVGCHSQCEKYKAWRAEYDKLKEKIRQDHVVDTTIRVCKRRMNRVVSLVPNSQTKTRMKACKDPGR